MSSAALKLDDTLGDIPAKQRVLVVDDDAGIAESLQDILQAQGYDVRTASDGSKALEKLERQRFDLVLTDGQMEPMDGYELLQAVRRGWPGVPVVLMSAHATVDKAVAAMQEEAAHFLVKPFSAKQLLALTTRLLKGPLQDLVAVDPLTQSVRDLALRVAQTDATVMLSGPSGAGKEVFARYIHAHSQRADAPFVALNCAAIPDTMLEATLFGHEKGAFTGANGSHAGKFEQAQGGTLLLDEISEMDLGLQAKLLRVLQERELERLGASGTIKLDVRVLATTNRNLQDMVVAGEFREDLYYRLNVFPLNIPALNERPQDIVPLAEHLLTRRHSGTGAVPALSPSAADKLLQHRWPGNVRELDNVVQRALILGHGPTIHPADLQFEFSTPVVLPTAVAEGDGLHDAMRSSEVRVIEQALREGGSKKAAADLLGISPRTLRYRMARLREQGCLPLQGSH